MNNPPYIVTDIFKDVVANVAIALAKPVYAYATTLKELNESLQQLSESPSLFDKKFPLVWLVEPFTVTNDLPTMYGKVSELRMFIMTDSEKNYKTEERREINYRPTLWPIKYALKEEMGQRKEFFGYAPKQSFQETDYYYWGENQQNVLNDVVDTIELKFFNIKIQNNLNC